jgi:cephalosporin hydroxylase
MNDKHHLPVRWGRASMLDLWHLQVGLHHKEKYKGIGLAKFPQDLWTYEKLLDLSDPEVILEIGVNEGGFSRWLYDRLLVAQAFDANKASRTLIGVDIDIEKPKAKLSGLFGASDGRPDIRLLQCDLLDRESLKKAKAEIELILNGRSLLIIEDSGHTYETTKSALEYFSGLLRPGEWFIIEDTCVDIESLRESEDWPRGALMATDDFLREDDSFERTDFNHSYEITCHPYGFLRKKLTTIGT